MEWRCTRTEMQMHDCNLAGTGRDGGRRVQSSQPRAQVTAQTGSRARRQALETELPVVLDGGTEIRCRSRPRLPRCPPVQGGSGQSSPRLKGRSDGQGGCEQGLASPAGPRRPAVRRLRRRPCGASTWGRPAVRRLLRPLCGAATSPATWGGPAGAVRRERCGRPYAGQRLGGLGDQRISDRRN
jgi:hypothetical protein